MSDRPPIPQLGSPIADARGALTKPWRDFLLKLAAASDNATLAAELAALADRVSDLEQSDDLSTLILGQGSVRVYGTLESGAVRIQLENDAQAPGVTYFYGTGITGTKGWHRIYDSMEAGEGIAITDSGYTVLGEVDTPDDLPGTGNTGEAWRVVEPAGLYAWDGSAFTLDSAATGVVGYRLAPLADTNIGAALVKLTRDGYGRVEGTEAAVLDDLSDVDAAAPSTGDALVFDGANWAPGQVATEQLFQRMTPEADFRITADGNLRVTT